MSNRSGRWTLTCKRKYGAVKRSRGPPQRTQRNSTACSQKPTLVGRNGKPRAHLPHATDADAAEPTDRAGDYRHHRQMWLVLVVVGRLARARRAALGARLHVVESVAG